jgi:hypothetical protein
MLHLVKRVWTDPMVALFLVIVVVPMALLMTLVVPHRQEVRVASAYKNVDIPVINKFHRIVGWWDISYPVSLRMEQHKSVVVSYRQNGQWLRLSPIPTFLSVSVSGVDLDIAPTAAHDFNIEQITSGEEDTHVWTITPAHPGSHTLVFTFNVTPASFRTLIGNINGNSTQIAIAGQLDRSLEVYTILGLPLSWDFLLGKLGNAIAFIAALPAFKFIVQSIFKSIKGRRVRLASARTRPRARKS